MFSRQRTALVVIDMVPFFVSDSSYCLGIVPNISGIAAALRKAGGTVAWVVPDPAEHVAVTEEPPRSRSRSRSRRIEVSG
jgi:nicotinamidase-related amidase